MGGDKRGNNLHFTFADMDEGLNSCGWCRETRGDMDLVRMKEMGGGGN